MLAKELPRIMFMLEKITPVRGRKGEKEGDG